VNRPSARQQRPLALSPATRQRLFQGLARVEQSGLPASRGLRALAADSPGALRRRLERLAITLEHGVPLGRSGVAAGLFTPWEGRLLHAAAEAGTLEAVLLRLAEHHAIRLSWQRRVRSRLALPLTLLVLLLLIAPLPALVGGALDAAAYLQRTLLPITALVVLMALMRAFSRRHAGRDLPNSAERLLLLLPGLGRLLRLRNRRDLLMSLALLLAAGRPAVDALGEAAETVRNPVLRGAYQQAADDVAQGRTVSEALAACGALDRREGLPLVSSGEFAGSLDRLVELHAEQLNDRLGMIDDALAEWLPRLLYIGILGLLAYGILSMVW